MPDVVMKRLQFKSIGNFRITFNDCSVVKTNLKLGKEKYRYTVDVMRIIQDDFCVTFVTKNSG